MLFSFRGRVEKLEDPVRELPDSHMTAGEPYSFMKTNASRKLRNFLECGGSTPLFLRTAKSVEEAPILPSKAASSRRGQSGVEPPHSK